MIFYIIELKFITLFLPRYFIIKPNNFYYYNINKQSLIYNNQIYYDVDHKFKFIFI